MRVNNELIEDPLRIANGFNNFFVKKIEDLKSNIDPILKTDPLNKLKKLLLLKL